MEASFRLRAMPFFLQLSLLFGVHALDFWPFSNLPFKDFSEILIPLI